MELSFPVDPLDELRRLCREACVRQFANEPDAAAEILRKTLPARMQQLRETAPEATVSPDTVQMMFAEEYRRVRDAHLVGEIIVPVLQRSLSRSPSFPPTEAPPAAPRSARAKAVPSSPQSITDMLDSMLAQDSGRTTRR